MSKRSGPNGWQPPLPGQPPPNYDNNSDSNRENIDREFCRDFIWGKCNKGFRCKFLHELDYAEMKKTLKFCHEYQNSGCVRDRCTFLHASQEEQNLFEATGQPPAVLAQRYANMSATAETIPQIARYIQESLARPPPPPPLPPVAVSAPLTLPTNVTTPPSVHPPRPPILPVSSLVPIATPVLPIQQLPPPPPPPTVSSTMIIQQTAVFTAPPPCVSSFSIAQPLPQEIPKYDASVPPPPIPKVKKSVAMKRPTDMEKARPAKIRKEEDKKQEEICQQCSQREERIDSLREQFEMLYAEEEYGTLMYKKKIEEYQSRKELLKSLFTTDFFRFIEENEEDIQEQQIHNLLGQATQSSNVTGVSTVPKQLLLQLMDYVIGDSKNFESASTSSSHTRFDDSLRQPFSSLPRKPNPVKTVYNHTNHNSSSTEMLQSVMDILKQFNSSEKPQSSDTRNADVTHNTSTSTSAGGSTYSVRRSDANASSSRFPPPALPGIPSSSTFATPSAVVSAPPPYQPYQHTMPSSGLYYPPPFPGPSGSQNVSENQQMRLQGPRAMAPVPPPPHIAPPVQQAQPQVPQPYAYPLGRYPPPYYPRHQ